MEAGGGGAWGLVGAEVDLFERTEFLGLFEGELFAVAFTVCAADACVSQRLVNGLGKYTFHMFCVVSGLGQHAMNPHKPEAQIFDVHFSPIEKLAVTCCPSL